MSLRLSSRGTINARILRGRIILLNFNNKGKINISWFCTVLLAIAIIGQTVALAATSHSEVKKGATLKSISELFDLRKLPYARNYRAYLASSYDREGGNYDWGNYERFDGEEGLILDVDGPGMIVRAWSANSRGRLRIYLDGNSTPVIDENFRAFLDRMPLRWGINRPARERAMLVKLLKEKNQPLGRTTYCVIPFSKGCTVTLTVKSNVYYQFNYLLFDQPHGLSTYTPESLEQQQPEYERIQQLLDKGLPPSKNALIKKGTLSLKSGAKKTILDVSGPLVIEKIVFNIKYPKGVARRDHAKENLLLRAYWDSDNRGEYSRPSIKSPLAYFFMDLGVISDYQTVCLQKKGSRYQCCFPMPVREQARIELFNKSVDELKNIQYEIHYAPLDAWDSQLCHFKALYHSEDSTFGIDEADYENKVMHRSNQDGRENYSLLRAWGQGHYVGSCFLADMSETPYVRSTIESDEAVFVDGDPSRTMWGTGTEDYLNDAWGLHTFARSLSGGGGFYESDMRQAFGYRFHLSDAITFNKKIFFTLEHGSSNNSTSLYKSIAYYYMTEAIPSERKEKVAPRDMKEYFTP
jgi:D-arabinan exo alpha-(1,3)/(1,5)-arabinofuranosidase (non-reducing end)